MDFSEESQLRIYELKEEKKALELEISEEQYANRCLHQKRTMLSSSVIKNIICILYFLFLYLGVSLLEKISNVLDAVKDNPVVQKLLELSDTASMLLQLGLLLAVAVSAAFLIRKLYLIWLNSDNADAVQQAEKRQLRTYNRQIADSDRKLAALLFRLQEIEEELNAGTEAKEINEA
ncbi:MAG: hypothetical protein NC089_11250 [Bacteroides sp.]|nr:hypothetical protein [Bacteroides sp.]MCM1550172.1 hypothetical protein [Clostridium sp.]